MKQAVDEWKAARVRAMRALDVEGFRALLIADGVESACTASDEVLLLALHKSRHQSPSIEPRLRLESAAWLRARGYVGLRGAPVADGAGLPGGEH